MRFSIIATGDSLITERLPKNDPACLCLKELFDKADVAFTNFEMTCHDYEVAASAVSGGTWVSCRPPVIRDLKWLGFNMFAVATNHSLDWGQDGLMTTIRHLKENDCVFAGVGSNLFEANMPCYVDTPEGRVGMVSCCSSGKDWHIAGEARPDIIGRPGMNYLRFNMVNYLSKEDLETLKTIINKTDVNARQNQLTREGFQKAAEGFAVGDSRFEASDTPGTKTFLNKKDKARLLKGINEARIQADVVLVSQHVHEFRCDDKALPPDFEIEFAHTAIDAGADAFFGHGPHQLRGIEIYKGKPIFYSLGNFLFKTSCLERQPAEFFEKYGLGPENTVSEAYVVRSKNWTSGQFANPKCFESIMPRFEVVDGVISEVELIPITLGFNKQLSRKGRAELASIEDGERILQELQQLSEEFGTKIEIRNGRGYIKIN